jgi:hypothetical protein
VPTGAPVVIGLDDTIERRWGAKISARGIYRDPVRSSKGHFVKASGLRWLSAKRGTTLTERQVRRIYQERAKLAAGVMKNPDP